MRPRSLEGTSAMKVRAVRGAVLPTGKVSIGEGTGLEPVPETAPVPTRQGAGRRDGVNTDAVATAEVARVRYRKVFACSAGDSPDEEPS